MGLPPKTGPGPCVKKLVWQPSVAKFSAIVDGMGPGMVVSCLQGGKEDVVRKDLSAQAEQRAFSGAVGGKDRRFKTGGLQVGERPFLYLKT